MMGHVYQHVNSKTPGYFRNRITRKSCHQGFGLVLTQLVNIFYLFNATVSISVAYNKNLEFCNNHSNSLND